MFLKGAWILDDALKIGSYPIITTQLLENLDPVKVFINLTETPYGFDLMQEKLIDTLHVPMKDFSVPTPLQLRVLLRNMLFYYHTGLPMYLHCMGGFGRAGTVAACFLITQGKTAQEAIHTVRKCRPGAIETHEQEVFIYTSEEWIPAIIDEKDQLAFEAKKLIEVLRRKCPWDKKQTHTSLIASLLDETFEVVESIREENAEHLKEELGDLVIQPLIQAQIAEENEQFTIYDSIRQMIWKLVYRHPHVFKSQSSLNAKQVIDQWTALKTKENTTNQENPSKQEKSVETKQDLFQEVKLISEEASTFGFDWEKADDIIDKIEEECEEVRNALHTEHSRRVEQELGDLLFATLNFARYYGIDPQKSLQRGKRKFEIRFRYIQRLMKQDDILPQNLTPQELDEYWEKAKKELPDAY